MNRKYEAKVSNESRIAVLETTISNINSTLERMEKRFDKIDARFDKIDNRFDTLEAKYDKKFDAINDRLWSNFLWIIGMLITLAGLIAHTQHWI